MKKIGLIVYDHECQLFFDYLVVDGEEAVCRFLD